MRQRLSVWRAALAKAAQRGTGSGTPPWRLLAVAVAGLLVVGAAAFVVLRPGPAPVSALAPVVQSAPVPASGTSTTTTVPVAPGAHGAAKDPFATLVPAVAPSTVAAPAAPATSPVTPVAPVMTASPVTAAPATTPVTAAPVTVPPTAAPTTAAPTPSTAPTTKPPTTAAPTSGGPTLTVTGANQPPATVTLQGIAVSGATKVAGVDVNGTNYLEAAGATFGPGVQVVAIGTQCANFQYAGVAFTLCQGQSATAPGSS